MYYLASGEKTAKCVMSGRFLSVFFNYPQDSPEFLRAAPVFSFVSQ